MLWLTSHHGNSGFFRNPNSPQCPSRVSVSIFSISRNEISTGIILHERIVHGKIYKYSESLTQKRRHETSFPPSRTRGIDREVTTESAVRRTRSRTLSRFSREREGRGP